MSYVSRSKICFSIVSLCIISLLTGCASGRPATYFQHQPLSTKTHIKVAIIPLKNFASHREADKKVSYSLITNLLKTNYFDVIEMGETLKAMKSAKVRKDADLSHTNIKKIGQLTGADALLMGVVEEYKIDSTTMLGEKVFVPEVSISMRLVSTKDASILWAANHHRRGDDRVTVFGMGRVDSISHLTDIILTSTVKELVRAMKNRERALAIFKRTAGTTTVESSNITTSTKNKTKVKSSPAKASKKEDTEEPVNEAPKKPISKPTGSREEIKSSFSENYKEIQKQY